MRPQPACSAGSSQCRDPRVPAPPGPSASAPPVRLPPRAAHSQAARLRSQFGSDVAVRGGRYRPDCPREGSPDSSNSRIAAVAPSPLAGLTAANVLARMPVFPNDNVVQVETHILVAVFARDDGGVRTQRMAHSEFINGVAIPVKCQPPPGPPRRSRSYISLSVTPIVSSADTFHPRRLHCGPVNSGKSSCRVECLSGLEVDLLESMMTEAGLFAAIN